MVEISSTLVDLPSDWEHSSTRAIFSYRKSFSFFVWLSESIKPLCNARLPAGRRGGREGGDVPYYAI